MPLGEGRCYHRPRSFLGWRLGQRHSSSSGGEMKTVYALVALIASGFFSLPQELKRPPITGFAHVAFYTSKPEDAKHFYIDLLGLDPGERTGIYTVGRQRVEVLAENPPEPP